MPNPVLLKELVTPSYLAWCARLFARRSNIETANSLRRLAEELEDGKTRIQSGPVSAVFMRDIAARLER